MSAELAAYVPIEGLTDVPPPPPARPRVLLVATVLASAAAAMGFAGLVAVYLATRAEAVAADGAFLPDGATIPLTPANMMLAGFGLSVVFMHWAVQAIGVDDRRHTWMAFAAVLVIGAFHFVGTGFLYSQAGIAIESPEGLVFYAVSGAQLALTGAGLLFTALMAFRTLGGQYSAKDREGVVAATVFWWVVAASYVVLWYTIYVTK
jgi:heme/copper-type cytochrome/quinol oxidase subunit 3